MEVKYLLGNTGFTKRKFVIEKMIDKVIEIWNHYFSGLKLKNFKKCHFILKYPVFENIKTL